VNIHHTLEIQRISIKKKAKRKQLSEATQFSVADIAGGALAFFIAHYTFFYILQYHNFYIWTILASLTHYGRLFIYWLIRHKHLKLNDKQWETTLILSSLLSGISWGSIILFIPSDTVYVLITMCLFFGIIGGAIGAVGKNFPLFSSFTIPICTPFIIYFIQLQQNIFDIMSFMITSYMLISLYISYQLTQTTIQETILTLEKQQLVQQLEKANADKSRFLASASHDLRQPLQALNLFAESLKQQSQDNEQKELLNKLCESTQDMGSLLNSLLDMSKLDAGLVQANESNFLLAPILRKLEKQTLTIGTGETSLNVSIKVKPFHCNLPHINISNVIVRSDPILLENILSNLLRNAIKFTPQGTVTITCMHTEECYIVQIHDTGIGINPKEQNKIFNAFYQVHNQQQGLGLGLSIVKHLCLLLKHKITLQSERGKGSTFQLYLPKASKVTYTEPIQSIISNHIGATILTIDDNLAISNAMQTMLRHWGFHILTATCLDNAIEILNHHTKLDIMLVDYRLQGNHTGIYVIDSIRKHLYTPQIPAIIITGDTAPEVLKLINKAGFEILHKPIKPAQLRSLITHLLNSTKKTT